MCARLSYTSVFERVVETAVSTTGIYGALMAVQGAAGTVTISTPNLVSPAVQAKSCFDFGVVNVDGAHPVIVATPDGKTLNGGANITLPASAGAFAWVFFDLTIGQWVAIINIAGAAFVPPPTYTARGPSAPQAITGSPVAVGTSSITTAAFSAAQKAIVTYSVQVNTTAGQQDDNTLSIFDGVAGNPIDTFAQTCGNSNVDLNPAHNTISWTLEIVGNGSARTFGLAVSGANPGNCTIPTNGCRGVVQIVDG